MNKIFNAFSSITASDELKEKTYQTIIDNNIHKSSKKINFFHLSLAMTSIIICIFIYSINDDKNNNLATEPEVDIFNATDTSIDKNDFIIYNGIKYIGDNSIAVEEDMLEEKIGYTNLESFQNNIPIYSIKNIDKAFKVAIVSDNQILVFIVEN